jgi:hypothetical protein
MDYQPDEQEQQVLSVLRDYHTVNPMLIREETGLRKEYVSRALDGLQKAGVVEKVTRGLYQHIPEQDDEYTATSACGVDLDELRNLVDEARDAYENIDNDRLENTFDRLEELLDAE